MIGALPEAPLLLEESSPIDRMARRLPPLPQELCLKVILDVDGAGGKDP